MTVFKALLASSVLFLLPLGAQAEQNVLNFTDRVIPQGVLKQISEGKMVDIPGAMSEGRNWGTGLALVKLQGKTNHLAGTRQRAPTSTTGPRFPTSGSGSGSIPTREISTSVRTRRAGGRCT